MPKVFAFLHKKYPQNFIIQNPFIGSLIFLVFCFIFILVYRPMNTHASGTFTYPVTMAIYSTGFSLVTCLIIMALKKIGFFPDKEEWTFFNEIASVFLVLLYMGIGTYFIGFIMENPENRWNLATFWNSCEIAFFIGIIPMGFFTLLNFRYLFVTEIEENYRRDDNQPVEPRITQDTKIQISSRLKKEELSFYPQQFIYAEADGNYVVFHLEEEPRTRKEIIRNSISDIEQQLTSHDFMIRTHRAFIVNVKKVRSKKGNTLGYKIKLMGADSEIPVSRQKVQSFDNLLNRFK